MYKRQTIYKASRNERLTNIINNLREQIQRYRTTSLAYPGRMKRSLEEHRGIVEAIQSRDAQLAHQVAREHIENAENSMIEAIKIDGLPLSD